METCAQLLELPEDLFEFHILPPLTKNSLLYESLLSFRCTCSAAMRMPPPSSHLNERYRHFLRLHYERDQQHLQVSPDTREAVSYLSLEFYTGTFDSLTSLRIDACTAVRSDFLRLLMAIFPSVDTVCHLTLFDTQIGDAGFVLLYRHALSYAVRLDRLCLRGNRLTDVSIRRLSMLRHVGMLPALVELDLQHNTLLDTGVLALASCGQDAFRALTSLNIASNYITNAGIAHLARHLLQGGADGCFPSLRFLDVGFNMVSDYGALLLAHACTVDFVLPHCTILLLNGNMFGFQGASELARTLRTGGLPSLAIIGYHHSILSRHTFVQYYD
jgi:hypothetical protein